MATHKEGSEELAPDFKFTNVKNGEWNPLYTDRNCGQRVIGQRQEDGDFGEINDVAVPSLPYEKWIDNTGGQTNLVIGNNRDPGSQNGQYKQLMRRRKLAAGWIPYHFETAREVGMGMDCKSKAEWAKRRDAQAKKLQEKHNRKQARTRDIGKSEMQKFIEKVGGLSPEQAKLALNAGQKA